MMKLNTLLILALFSPMYADEIRKPNIIVIYTDDQGYGDASVLNSEAKFQTPSLDLLANEGVAFTNGHSADTVCTPSRYALLTGRYPWRTNRKKGVLGAEGKCMIKDTELTLASMLKQQGYNTGIVGKWHLGMDFPGTPKNRDWSKPTTDMPLDKGFDYFYGIPASLNFGVLAWFEGRYAKVPPTLYTNKKENPRHVDYRIMPPYDKRPKGPDRHVKQAGFEIAPDFTDNMCLTRFTEKAIDWIKQKAPEAKQGKPFFLYLPYTSPHYPVCPLPEFQGKGQAGAYGEFIIETDHHVGQILSFLKTQGLDENTLVVFTSDNGPEKSWPERITDFGHDSRGGLQGGKRSIYEGGHRVPFIIRWPAGIKQPNRTWDKIVGQVDLLATFAEITGASLHENVGVDSQSFAKVLTNPDANLTRLPLINRGETGNRYSITEGNWKLILPSKSNHKNSSDTRLKAELYDLSTDKGELTNLAAQHPDKVKVLKKKITAIIANGRTTPGVRQPNDTDYWDALHWMTKEEYHNQ